MSNASIKLKWKKVKVAAFSSMMLVTIIILFEILDPYSLKKGFVVGSVTQSVQMFPRYRESYNRVVVKLNDGHLIQFETPIGFNLKKEQNVKIQVFQRDISGLIKYELY